MEWIKNEGDVDIAIDDMIARIIEEIEEFQNYGSGFRWDSSVRLDIKVMEKGRGLARSHKVGTFIQTPPWIARRRAVHNMKPPKEDNKCFAWALLRGMYPLKGELGGIQRQSVNDLKDHLQELVLPKNASYPIPLDSRIFLAIEEKNTWCSFSVFYLGHREGEIYQVYLSHFRRERERHIRLGVITDPRDSSKAHFVLIRKMGALLGKTHKEQQEICEYCLTFHALNKIKDHEALCRSHQPTKVIMPTPNSEDHKLQFRQWQYRLVAPFVIYADFECLLLKPENATQSVVHQHVPCGFAYTIICQYSFHEKEFSSFLKKPLKEIRTYIGPNAAATFLQWLWDDAKLLWSLVNEKAKEYEEQPGDREAFITATHCHICSRPFVAGDRKHLDHDHFTGEYRGAAHDTCNEHYTTWKKYYQVPVIFHNLRGYDGYIIIRGVKDVLPKTVKIEPIAKSPEKYTSFTLCMPDSKNEQKLSIRFIDSIQFMQGSLDQHVNNLRNSFKDEKDLSSAFSIVSERLPFVIGQSDSLSSSQFQMALRKGIFPYEYMTSMDSLNETQLPNKEAFSSSLSGRKLSDEEYQQALDAWDIFHCQTLGDYTKVYVALDVLLLACVFERFRATCLHPTQGYGLDPVHFVTAPSLSWSAMLYHNYKQNIIIETMIDEDMLLLVEKGIRGGMCQVFHPLANANYKGMNQKNIPYLPTYNEHLPESHILYLDANNLYGWAMSQPLPFGDYVWEKYLEERPNPSVAIQGHDPSIWFEEDMKLISSYIQQLDPFGPYGWILEVDLDYLKELHDKHNDYPLCPERKRMTPSPYTIQLAEKLGLNVLQHKERKLGYEKLVLDLSDKRNYVIHYRNLQQCLDLGLQLKKVHRVFRFKQSAWLKSYIDMNTERRKQAKDSVAKDFFKLMNNSIFGKTMEQVRKRRNVEFIIGNKKIQRAKKILSSPFIKSYQIIEDDAILALNKHHQKVVMNRPVILGMTILDLSKLHMFNFHYKVMQKHFGDRLQLCYTDTDSLVYLLTAKEIGASVFDDLRGIQDEYDCFDYSEMKDDHHPLLIGQDKMKNARVLGKFKDELFGKPLIQFIALRPKMYSMIGEDDEEKSRRKGIPKTVTMRHQDYLKVLWLGSGESVSFQRIDHNKHFELQTLKLTKKGLNACDDKSHYFDALKSVRYGHYSIPQKIQQSHVTDLTLQ
jgi:hypothetical protein